MEYIEDHYNDIYSDMIKNSSKTVKDILNKDEDNKDDAGEGKKRKKKKLLSESAYNKICTYHGTVNVTNPFAGTAIN